MTYLYDLQEHFRTYTPKFYPPFANRKNNISAGVLVALYEDQDWTCIMTQRSSLLKDHSGEMCFPGGKQQKEDEDVNMTDETSVPKTVRTQEFSAELLNVYYTR